MIATIAQSRVGRDGWHVHVHATRQAQISILHQILQISNQLLLFHKWQQTIVAPQQIVAKMVAMEAS